MKTNIKTISKAELLKKLGGILHVSNLSSPRTGNSVPNQFNLTCQNGSALQSYDSLIAVRVGDTLYLTDRHDFSVTTSKYATEWTGLTTKERREGLKNGVFVLIKN